MSDAVVKALHQLNDKRAPGTQLDDAEIVALAEQIDAYVEVTAERLAAHRYVIGGGPNAIPDHCSCGEWWAASLTDVEANDKSWREHVARAMGGVQ